MAAEKAKRPGKVQAMTTVPEWAGTTAIAQLLGRTTRRIQQLTQDGVLATEVPPGGGARKYKTCETVRRYIDHVEQKAKESGASGAADVAALKKLEAEADLKESQAQLHRLKTAIAERRYIPAEQATEELADFMANFQKFALSIPARVAGAMAGYTDAGTARSTERTLRREIEAMLTAFADGAIVEEPVENGRENAE